MFDQLMCLQGNRQLDLRMSGTHDVGDDHPPMV